MSVCLSVCIAQLHDLFQSSFGGLEAESVRALAEDVAYKEHQVDVLQRKILKKFYLEEEAFTFASFHLWMRILESVAALSNLSEKLANCIRVVLERK